MATKNFMSNILDELMGRNRDALPTDIPKEIQWDDPEICPYYLVCFCPHELFVNTKADLGTCSKFHDDQLRKKYLEEAPIYKRSQFEKEFLRFAEKMISDIEGKIKRGKHRIAAANGADGGIYAGPGSRNAEEIVLLTDRINVLLEEAEAAGCEGDVEKAQGIMKLCDQIKEEREKLKSNEISHPWNPDKAMQVCEVCGSYLIIGEAQHRLDDHIMGKQHVGFAMLRKNMEDVRKALQKREADDREQMELERERRLSSRRDERTGPSPNSDRRRDDSRRGGSDRGRDSYRRGRERDDRDVDRDRDRKRHRSRSRDKDRKDKEKDKDRHRDKDKDKDRKRHSSRDRRRHSDSKRERRSKRSRSRSKSKSRKRSRSKSRDRKDKDRHSHRRNRDNDKDNDKGRDKDAHPKEEKEITGRLRSGSPGSDKMEENSGHIEKDVDDAEGKCSRKSKSPCPDSSNLADVTEEEFQGKESPASSGSV